jgi:hypothetical protein
MRRLLPAGCALLACLAWMPAQAQVLYDSFSAGHIDPEKWDVLSPLCASPRAYDCAREVQLGALHLRVRGYGAVEVPESQVFFKNPEPIDTIRFSFIVTSFSGQGCDSSEDVHPQLVVYGSFFRSGGSDVRLFCSWNVSRTTRPSPPAPSA